jgi:hypothetical protein
MGCWTHLCFSCASLASLELASLALVDESKLLGVTQVAIPEDESSVRLDQLEAM